MTWPLIPGKLGFMLDRVLVALKRGTLDTPQALLSEGGRLHTLNTAADGAQLSAFGRLRTAEANTLFDAQQEYGLNTRTAWNAAANGTLAAAASDGSASSGGNAVGPTDANTRMTPITVTATDTHYAILQSKQYVRYIPGKGHLIYVTGVFAAGVGATAAITLRSSTSGAAVDTTVQQASWSEDPFDGTGPSEVVLDFTKVQVLVIDAQMLYAGRVRVGFDIDGTLYYAHAFNIANNQAVQTLQTFNLPVRLEGRTGAASTTFRFGYFDLANGVFLETTRTTKGGTINFICCSVQSEGGKEARGVPRGAGNGITAVAVTTRRPVLSIRPKATFNSRTNRAHIELLSTLLRASTNDSYFEIVIGGTLTGASFASVDADSVTEVDVAASAITGGVTAASGTAISGQGASALLTQGELDIRTPLTLSQIDALTATQTIVSVVCTSFTGTSNVAASINWHEQSV
jgi:hypothetical protein